MRELRLRGTMSVVDRTGLPPERGEVSPLNVASIVSWIGSHLPARAKGRRSGSTTSKDDDDEAVQQERDVMARPDVVPVEDEDDELEDEEEVEEEDRESDEVEEREDVRTAEGSGRSQ